MHSPLWHQRLSLLTETRTRLLLFAVDAEKQLIHNHGHSEVGVDEVFDHFLTTAFDNGFTLFEKHSAPTR